MKIMQLNRKGVSAPSALLLFLVCALASAVIITNSFVNASINALVRDYEKQYSSVSSAAIMIRDSMINLSEYSVIAYACLQCADSKGAVLTITIESIDLPTAVCSISFDNDLDLEAIITARSVAIRLTMQAATPGKIGWMKEKSLIERTDKSEYDP